MRYVDTPAIKTVNSADFLTHRGRQKISFSILLLQPEISFAKFIEHEMNFNSIAHRNHSSPFKNHNQRNV